MHSGRLENAPFKGECAMYRKNAWENLAEDEKEQLSAFAKDYMAFLNNGKTER